MSEIDDIRARLANGGSIFRRQSVEKLLAAYDAALSREAGAQRALAASMENTRRVTEERDEARKVLEFHPRAAKLMRKKKNFVVIAEDEPYFIDAYKTIRANEQKAGRWTNEDEKQYQIALANSLG